MPKKNTMKDRFRKSKTWQKKAQEIAERDKYLCRVCAKEGTIKYDKLSVHHIVPLEKDFDKRLENDNLITLCIYHHRMAEASKISKAELYELIP